nr:IclR family transcriptional regulator C-terminal domain-containing protein [Leucobacter weissii]
MVALSVDVGTRLPSESTALGKVLLASLSPEHLETTLALAPRSPVIPHHPIDRRMLEEQLREIRAQGWAATDEEIHPGVRSVAAPLRDGEGRVFAAINIAAISSELSHRQLIDECLPLLLRTASQISTDYAQLAAAPQFTVSPG